LLQFLDGTRAQTTDAGAVERVAQSDHTRRGSVACAWQTCTPAFVAPAGGSADGCALSAGGATRHRSRAGPSLASRTRWLGPLVPPAGAPLMEWASARSGAGQPGLDPLGAGPAPGRPAGGGSAGHNAARAVGSLAGGHRHGGPHATDWVGRDPLSLCEAVPRGQRTAGRA
jgi:hypothetical protein